MNGAVRWLVFYWKSKRSLLTRCTTTSNVENYVLQKLCKPEIIRFRDLQAIRRNSRIDQKKNDDMFIVQKFTSFEFDQIVKPRYSTWFWVIWHDFWIWKYVSSFTFFKFFLVSNSDTISEQSDLNSWIYLIFRISKGSKNSRLFIETEYFKAYRCFSGALQVPSWCHSGALQVLFQVPSWCLTGVLPGAFQVPSRCRIVNSLNSKETAHFHLKFDNFDCLIC